MAELAKSLSKITFKGFEGVAKGRRSDLITMIFAYFPEQAMTILDFYLKINNHQM